MNTITETLRSMHAADTFVMPNAWDRGSARILESSGFEALGVRQVSIGSSLYNAAARTLSNAASELRDHGTSRYAR